MASSAGSASRYSNATPNPNPHPSPKPNMNPTPEPCRFVINLLVNLFFFVDLIMNFFVAYQAAPNTP